MSDTEGPRILNSGPDADLVYVAIRDIEAFDKELESEKGAYMVRCKKIRDRRKIAVEEFRDKGLDKRNINDLLAIRKNARKIEEIRKNRADDDDVKQLDMFMEAFARGEAKHKALEADGKVLQPGITDDGDRPTEDNPKPEREPGQPDWAVVGEAIADDDEDETDDEEADEE